VFFAAQVLFAWRLRCIRRQEGQVKQRERDMCFVAIGQDFLHELAYENFALHVLPSERAWRVQYGEASFSKSRKLNFVLKCALMLTIFACQYYSFLNWGDRLKFYPIYLTYWTLNVQSAYHVASVVMAVQAIKWSTPSCGVVQVTTVLRAIVQPCALLVSIGYWGCSGFGDTSVENVAVHGVNSVVIMIDLMTTRQCFRLVHGVWTLSYVFLYASWTYVHDALGITSSRGTRFIYEWCDWAKFQATCLHVFLLLFVITPAMVVLVWSFVWIRDRLIGDMDRARIRREVEEARRREWTQTFARMMQRLNPWRLARVESDEESMSSSSSNSSSGSSSAVRFPACVCWPCGRIFQGCCAKG